MIGQGEIWWADLDEPIGSAPGYRRPVVIVQGDSFNASRIATVVIVPLTGSLKWADMPGNVRLGPKSTGLSRDSVANPSQIISIDKGQLIERVGKISERHLDHIFAGIDLILGR